jgi:succinyl-CoA synthetase alpha subunit
MSIFADKNTRLLVQGITGNEGLFHTQQMLAYGTKVVAGTRPGKGGEWVLDGKIPVFDSCKAAVEATGANTSIIFVAASLHQMQFLKQPMQESLSSFALPKELPYRT